MAKWSVALFGHYKPNYYLLDSNGKMVSSFIDKPTDFDTENFTLYKTIGVDKRAIPGDIIAFRPFEEKDKWTSVERKRFLIVTIDGLTADQIEALCEPNFDTDSVFPTGLTQNQKNELRKNIGEPFHPQKHINKRRFNIPLDDLYTIGVDTERMLNTSLEYTPDVSSQDVEICSDKLKNRKANKEQDKFRLLDPVILTEEIINGLL